jgi:hypothetical protein
MQPAQLPLEKRSPPSQTSGRRASPLRAISRPSAASSSADDAPARVLPTCFPAALYPASPHRKRRGCQMTSDLTAQIRINLESIELAARSCREMSGTDGQALFDRIQSMIELSRPALTKKSCVLRARTRRGLLRDFPTRPLVMGQPNGTRISEAPGYPAVDRRRGQTCIDGEVGPCCA